MRSSLETKTFALRDGPPELLRQLILVNVLGQYEHVEARVGCRQTVRVGTSALHLQTPIEAMRRPRELDARR